MDIKKCDRCGATYEFKDIKSANVCLADGINERKINYIGNSRDYFHADLCPLCYKSFELWWNSKRDVQDTTDQGGITLTPVIFSDHDNISDWLNTYVEQNKDYPSPSLWNTAMDYYTKKQEVEDENTTL